MLFLLRSEKSAKKYHFFSLDIRPWRALEKTPQQTCKMMHFVNLKLIQKGFIHSIVSVCIQEYIGKYFLEYCWVCLLPMQHAWHYVT